MDMHSHDPVIVATPGALTITALFRAQAARTPQAPALESAGRSFSYAELDSWSDGLAQRFMAAGVRRGDLVGIRGVRRAETVAALFGILKAGAAYLPLNPSDPASRLRRILEDAAPVAVVEPEKGGHSAIPFTGIVLDVCGFDDDCFPARSAGFTDVSVDDLAYVCYTSGSTGQPKGVMIPHRGVARLVRNTNYIDIRQDDVFLHLAPLSFDASTFEIWGALLNGAKLVVYGPENVELGDLGRSIRDNKISTLWLTSALFNLMVDGELESLLGVRHLLAGGDVLSVPHVKKLLERMPAGHVLINGYGPTENTTFTCCHRMDRDSVINARIPIGLPVTGTDVVMVDEKGRPAPRNAAGEILVGGAGLARGYLKSLALDAEKFVSLAIQSGERRRFYRTGDLGAWNSDGTLDFRGRMDEQMKIRGFRVEPGEIEAALRGLEGIRDAAVALDEGEMGERQIRAFVVRDDTQLAVAAIKAGLQSALPDYMVPAAVRFLDALPVTPNGKVDRAALREMAVRSQNGSTTDPGNAPRDLLEHRLAAIWCRLFGRKDIGRDANFFELGGHSLLAAELAHEVEKLVGHRFPIARVFQAQTIAELAAMVEGEDWAPAWSSLVPLRAEGDKAPMFFVHGYGGDVYAFVHLVRAMEKGRPVYGLQAAELSGGLPPHETMEQMAAHYAREIRSFQPEGPYHLAGYSMGGWIAYAVAQELRKAGQEVAFLGLLDTHATANVSWYYYGLTIFPDLVDRAARHLQLLRGIPWSDKCSYLAGPLRTMWYFLTRSQRKSDDAYAAAQGWEADQYNLIHARYRPSAYDGRAEIFVATEEKNFSSAFWKKMVRGRVCFHQVDGSHHEMLSAANCPALARKIEAVLLLCRPGKIKDAVGLQAQDQHAADGSDTTVHRLFEEQAKKTPEAVAVEFGQERLTYRELNSRADRLASSLVEAGAGPDEVIGIYAPISIATLVGVLAVLKAGGAYLPVDIALPHARRMFLLQDSGCKIVLVRGEHAPQLREELQTNGLSPHVMDLDGVDSATDRSTELKPLPLLRPENLAYVLYTSGSTGQPKGVEMPHRALVNLLRWQKSISSDLKPGRTLQFANLGFDVSFQEIFATWTSGGTLVLVHSMTRLDPEALLHFVDRRKIDRLFLPFVVLEHLAAAAQRRRIVPTGLKEVFVAGEQLRISPGIRWFFGQLPSARLWNHYGPTETHVVTGFMLEGNPDSWLDLPPIGRALPNCEIHLLDESLQAAPVGAAADLYVSGLPLARGYRNQPELTAERFIRNPFEKTPGEKIYKTGDVARRLSDGTIEFLGRSDLQVKIRGHRIELGEVEAVVGKHPGVAGCTVLAVEGFGGRELVAFVIPGKDADLSLASLRQRVGRQLPDYMIPARFALLDVLPLTSNGKVDRQALAQTKGREVPIGVEYAAPRHELERKLSEIWKEVLAREAIGIQDNFFEMGGNSLLVTACCVEINKRLGLQVPLGLIFANPTIGGLAEKLNTFSDPAAPIPRADRHLALPASYGQEAMWFVQQILPDPATYNQPFAWRFSGSIDEKRLRVALETVMSRHEVLRTALVFEDGGLQQKISPAGELKLPWRKTVISEGSDPTRLLREESRGPFDLAHAPLWRALWVKLADDDNILLLTFHHSIIDEWSMRVLVAELQSLYAGDVPADLPLQYADYAVWQRRNLSVERLESATSYWRRQLADLPAPLSLPAAVKLPPQATGRGVTHGFELPAEFVSSLRSLARGEGTTVFVVMLAAFQLWLCRRSGQNDLVVATPFAARDRPETQSLIGCFLNTLPIRTKFEEGENFRALLRRVRETVVAAFDHAQLPFAKMVGLAPPRRESGDRSLFQAMFVLLEEGVQPVRLDQVVAREIICDTGTSKLDLTIFIHAEGDVWDCRLECSSDLFSQEQGARMAGEMADFFRAVA